MGALDIPLTPLRVTRALMRAAEDLHAVAEHGRGRPDRIAAVNDQLDRLSVQMGTLTAAARSLDRRAGEIVRGGEDLTRASEEIAAALKPVRAALPGLLHGLRAVEGLEDSVDTVAETVEPLQGLTRGVGRMSARLSRDG